MNSYKIRLTITEPLLGTVSLDKEMYEKYILNKHPELAEDESAGADELETIEEVLENGTTGFHREDGVPVIYDYAIKGFFKDACSMMRRVPKSGSSALKAYKKIIDGLVFVYPRRIPIQVVGEIDILTRPIRAQTAQGERIALARSEMVPADSVLEFEMQVLGGVDEDLLTEWFDYGTMRGLGQWRNAGYGRFAWELVD